MSATYNLVLVLICVLGVGFSWFKSREKTKKALMIAGKQFINVLPFLIAVFTLIGILEVFVPQKTVTALLGSGSGVFALLFAAAIGGIMSGPPAASYPMADFLLKQHASMAAVATFLVAWVAVGTISLPVEIKLLGARFAWTRWALTLVFSIVVGVVIGWLV
jgi:uncharacterized membrane protein YraQ (UPF0718 family)